MKSGRFRIFDRREKVATVLAMAAVLLRCLIAPGLMFDQTAMARGELKLVICTASGAKSFAAASDQGPAPYQQDDHELCPYAAPSHAGALAHPVPWPASAFSLLSKRRCAIGYLSAPMRNFAGGSPNSSDRLVACRVNPPSAAWKLAAARQCAGRLSVLSRSVAPFRRPAPRARN